MRSCCFSPDGRLAVSGSDDKTVRVWDVATRQCIRVYDDHSGYVNSVAFHPDGTCVASAGTDNAIKVRLHAMLWVNQALRSNTCKRSEAEGCGSAGRGLRQGLQGAEGVQTGGSWGKAKQGFRGKMDKGGAGGELWRSCRAKFVDAHGLQKGTAGGMGA